MGIESRKYHARSRSFPASTEAENPEILWDRTELREAKGFCGDFATGDLWAGKGKGDGLGVAEFTFAQIICSPF